MLRVPFIIGALGLVTLALLPVQGIAVLFDLPLRRRIPILYHRTLCRLVGVRIKVVGAPMRARPLLIAANHSSWLDIPAITACTSVVFVAKREVADWPLIGLLAKLQRSVFVDRTRRHKTGEVNAEIAERLADGDPVVLFAEGTSSDGNRVLPFRSALIGAARDALAGAAHAKQVFIQPLSIAYTAIQGVPLGRRHRPTVAWYGRMPLAPHLVGVLRRGPFDVTVSWGEPVAYDGNGDRKEIARSLHAAVRDLTSAALRGSSVLAEAR